MGTVAVLPFVRQVPASQLRGRERFMFPDGVEGRVFRIHQSQSGMLRVEFSCPGITGRRELWFHMHELVTVERG